MKEVFNKLFSDLQKDLISNQILTAYAVFEDSTFTRFTKGKIRQTGSVTESLVHFSLYETRPDGTFARTNAAATFENSAESFQEVKNLLKTMQQNLPQAPSDPFLVLPKMHKNTDDENKNGSIPNAEELVKLFQCFEGMDAVGIVQNGTMSRAFASSLGQRNWFSTPLMMVDYSIVASNEKAVKRTFSTANWNLSEFAKQVQQAKEQVQYLEKPIQKLKPGKYKVFLEAEAVNALVSMFNWQGVSEGAIQRKESFLRHARSGERKFSELFTLTDDLSHGLVPTFDSTGKILPNKLPVVEQGKLVQGLCSERTAKEYKVPFNGASDSETMTSFDVKAGKLDQAQWLKLLGTGIYLPQLHYLNWSDRTDGRVTGMTRHACFWVQDGQIIGPIENMRFDDNLFDLFGSSLVDFTQQTEWHPETGTYEFRQLGGQRTPGALISEMNFPL